jgi:uncharacterized protein YecE (DUF72 family)
MALQHYFLGCPVWSNKAWVGELFTTTAKTDDYLPQYAQVFNTVEGNTTFYGMPTPATVAKWSAAAPTSFRFCFKFPQAITHRKRLKDANAETDLFLETLAPLGTRLGPFLLQLPPTFGVRDLVALEQFVRALPDTFQYAVEVRHPDFFDDGVREMEVNTLLTELGVERVHFDTRALRAAPATFNSDTAEAQERKPNLPVRFDALTDFPMVRYVSHPDVPQNDLWLSEWAVVVAEWVQAGKTPYFFVHAPDDFYAPRLARRFHTLLSDLVAVGTFPPFPAEQDGEEPQQLSLF